MLLDYVRENDFKPRNNPSLQKELFLISYLPLVFSTFSLI